MICLWLGFVGGCVCVVLVLLVCVRLFDGVFARRCCYRCFFVIVVVVKIIIVGGFVVVFFVIRVTVVLGCRRTCS